MPIRPLRDHLREQIRQELIDGVIPPGEQIRLEPLAQRHSVSVTPTREALTQLEAEGWVILRPHRGFFAAPMTLDEGRSIYPVLAALEVLAIELQGKPSGQLLERLREQNAELADSTSEPERAFELDRCWHEMLVGGCGNDLLIEHLRALRTQAERYDRAYMRYSGIVPMSADDHERIIEALARDPRDAAPVIRRNWQRSVDFLRDWLGDRDD